MATFMTDHYVFPSIGVTFVATPLLTNVNGSGSKQNCAVRSRRNIRCTALSLSLLRDVGIVMT